MRRTAALLGLTMVVAAGLGGCGSRSPAPPPAAAPPCTPATLGSALEGTGSLPAPVDIAGFGCAGGWARATINLSSPAGAQASADFRAYEGRWAVVFLGVADGNDDGVPAGLRDRLAALAAAPSPTTTTTIPASAASVMQQEATADAAVLTRLGFQALNLNDFTTYPVANGFHVIVGASGGAGGAEQAFFFVGTRWLGTDTAAPSAEVKVVSRDSTTITLSYGLFGAGDPQCCPSEGTQDVSYQLREPGDRVVPLQPIPPLSGNGARR